MKQYPLYQRDAIDCIDKIINLAKAKKAIWHVVWRRQFPAAFYMNMQLALILKMIDDGLLYAYRPKVYAFHEELPYENQVPAECISRCCFAGKNDRGIVVCHHKYNCDSWTKYLKD